MHQTGFGGRPPLAVNAWRAACLMTCLAAALLGEPAAADQGRPASAAESPPLAEREAELLQRYAELERSFLRLADLLATTDPRRAAVLRDAFGKAREAEVGDRLGRIVSLLEAERLLEAGAGQAGAIEQFRALLALLEAGGTDRNLADTKADVREFLARIGRLIARQRDLEGSTEAGAADADLAAGQRDAADAASGLADDLGQFAARIDESAPGPRDAAAESASGEGQPTPESDGGQSPGQGGESPESRPAAEQADSPEPIAGDDEASRARRTRRRVAAAEARMRAAREALDDARRRDARAEQEQAIAELETARAELEEILRQVREEEVERLLVQLEARIRTLLRMERSVQAAADTLAAAQAMSGRERQIEAARIGREQEAVTGELDRALTVVRDDGSAVAIPEALAQIQDDSRQAAARFVAGDLGATTQAIVGDILLGLEELLTALEKSRRDDDAGEQPGPGGGRPPEPGEQPLVDKLAELKMLRSLQLRVNARTERFASLLDAGAETAAEPALIDALQRLAGRQRAIEQAARDIVAGRTE